MRISPTTVHILGMYDEGARLISDILTRELMNNSSNNHNRLEITWSLKNGFDLKRLPNGNNK